MERVTIRPESELDVEAVLDVLETVGREGRWIGTEVPFDRAARAERLRHDLQNPETSAGFVAAVGGKVVGSIGLHLAPYGVVDIGMALVDGYRGQGIGTRLLERGI